MDKETIQTDLLAILKEAKNLPESELITIPGTSIKIKNGREREFRRLCDNFFEIQFNQVIQNDTDTITPVVDFLEREIKDETEEFLISEAYQFTSSVKVDMERFSALKRSLADVERNYDRMVQRLNDLYVDRKNTAEWRQNVDEKNEEVKRLSENSSNLREQMIQIKTNVNETLLTYLEKQMEQIRDSYTKTFNGTEGVLSVDKENFVLKTDEIEYNSLYLLAGILKLSNAKDNIDDFIIIDDAMIITPEQKETVEDLLKSIKFFRYIEKPAPTFKVRGSEENQKLIDEIERLKREDRAIYDEAPQIYQEIVQILKNSALSPIDLVPVWNMAYVSYDDSDRFEELLRASSYFKKNDPDYGKREKNEEIIKSLYTYLDSMADKVTNYSGVSNLPIKRTRTIRDNAWIVVDKDLEEANRIIDIIELLEQQENHLSDIWGIANVNAKDAAKFKQLVNATNYFDSLVPNIPENDAEMEKVHEALANLIRDAKENKNSESLANNGLVLASDLGTYKLLEEKYKYLEAAKASNHKVVVDGVYVDASYANRYHEINEQLKANLEHKDDKDEGLIDDEIQKLRQGKTDKFDSSEFEDNRKVIANMTKKIEEIYKKGPITLEEKHIVDLLEERIKILDCEKYAKSDADFVNVSTSQYDFKILASDRDRYFEINAEFEKLLGEKIDNLESLMNNEFEDNRKMIEIINKEIDEIISKETMTANERQIAGLLKSKKGILERAMSASKDEYPFDVLDDAGYKLKVIFTDSTRYSEINEEIQKLRSSELSDNNNLDDTEKPEMPGVGGKFEPNNQFSAVTPNNPTQSGASDDNDLGVNGVGTGAGTPNPNDKVDFSKNDALIAEIKKEMSLLEKKAEHSRGKKVYDGKILARDQKKYNVLKAKVECLENAKKSNDLVDVDGIKLDSKDAPIYQNLENTKINKIKKVVNKKNLEQLPKIAKDYIKKNWKVIIPIGLSLVALAEVLPALLPSIVFSNGCIAAAAPGLSGIFNGINMALAPFVSNYGAIAMGTQAALAFPATMTSLSSLGIVGVAGVTIKKYLDSRNVGRLPDPERKKAIDKIIEIGENLRAKGKKAVQAVKDKTLDTVIDINKKATILASDLQEKVQNAIHKDEEFLDDDFDEFAIDPSAPLVVEVPEPKVIDVPFREVEAAVRDAAEETANTPIVEVPDENDVLAQLGRDDDEFANIDTLDDDTITYRGIDHRREFLEAEAERLQRAVLTETNPVLKQAYEKRMADINLELDQERGLKY